MNIFQKCIIDVLTFYHYSTYFLRFFDVFKKFGVQMRAENVHWDVKNRFAGLNQYTYVTTTRVILALAFGLGKFHTHPKWLSFCPCYIMNYLI